MKDITVMILALGLMSLLGLIVVDEFMIASDHGGDLSLVVVVNAIVRSNVYLCYTESC